MERSCTPPNASTITLSDTTPLKRDTSGSAVYNSTHPKKASEWYVEMMFNNCKKFVGPTSAKRAIDYNVIFCILYVIIGEINYPPYIGFVWTCKNRMPKYDDCCISFC
jgi:hypothetical protein